MSDETSQWREHVRYRVNIPVRFLVNEKAVEGAHVFNISEGGLFVSKIEFLPRLGEEVDFQLEEGLEFEVRGKAKVVWRKTEGNEKGPGGFGLQFVEFNQKSEEHLSQLVEIARLKSL